MLVRNAHKIKLGNVTKHEAVQLLFCFVVFFLWSPAPQTIIENCQSR